MSDGASPLLLLVDKNLSAEVYGPRFRSTVTVTKLLKLATVKLGTDRSRDRRPWTD